MAPKREGLEWDSVEVVCEPKKGGNPEVKCKNCDRLFTGGVTRIRGHILHTPACGVLKCSKAPAALVTQLKQKVLDARFRAQC